MFFDFAVLEVDCQDGYKHAIRYIDRGMSPIRWRGGSPANRPRCHIAFPGFMGTERRPVWIGPFNPPHVSRPRFGWRVCYCTQPDAHNRETSVLERRVNWRGRVVLKASLLSHILALSNISKYSGLERWPTGLIGTPLDFFVFVVDQGQKAALARWAQGFEKFEGISLSRRIRACQRPFISRCPICGCVSAHPDPDKNRLCRCGRGYPLKDKPIIPGTFLEKVL